MPVQYNIITYYNIQYRSHNKVPVLFPVLNRTSRPAMLTKTVTEPTSFLPSLVSCMFSTVYEERKIKLLQNCISICNHHE